MTKHTHTNNTHTQLDYFRVEMQHLSDQCRQNREIGIIQGTEKAEKRVFDLEDELSVLRSTLASYQNK